MNNKYNNKYIIDEDDDSHCPDQYFTVAQKTLRKFYQDHPEIIFQSAELKEGTYEYDWCVSLHTKFIAKLVGSEDDTTITATWNEGGCSDDWLENFRSPDFQTSEYSGCIPQRGKWYQLDGNVCPAKLADAAIDIAIKEDHAKEAVEIIRNQEKRKRDILENENLRLINVNNEITKLQSELAKKNPECIAL